jgi:type VI secretion system protein ImpL
MALVDFAAFYNPAGVLWTFYDEVLDTHVEREGDRFEFARRLGRAEGQLFQPALLQFLKRSRGITEAFFPPGAEGPVVDFDVKIRPSPRVAIQNVAIGGKAVEYHNGPEEWVRFSWPGEEDPGAGAFIEIRGEGGIHERIEQEGEWGLFHLLEEGTVVSGAGARVFTVVWHLRTHDIDVTIDFRPVRADTPFFGVAGGGGRDIMSPVRSADVNAPHEIVSGDSTCRISSRGT